MSDQPERAPLLGLRGKIMIAFLVTAVLIAGAMAKGAGVDVLLWLAVPFFTILVLAVLVKVTQKP